MNLMGDLNLQGEIVLDDPKIALQTPKYEP